MNIESALKELINSESFKSAAKKDAKLRVFLSRYYKGCVRYGASVELLIRFGYTININKIKR